MSIEMISCPVRANAERIPRQPALVTKERTWSWVEMDPWVSKMAADLHDLAPSGSRITVRMPNSPILIAMILAALRTGHVLAPLSTRLPDETVNGLVKRIGGMMVGAEGRGLTTDHRYRVGRSSNVFHSRPSPADARPYIPLSRPTTIIHTSGSMGEPKSVLHTAGNHIWSARGLADVIPLTPQHRWLLTLPLYHVGGLAIVYRCALAGAAMVLPNKEISVGGAIEKFQVTHASLVYAQLYRLMQGDDVELRSLRLVLLGGSAIRRDAVDRATENGWPVLTSYGMTEMASTVAVGPANAHSSSGFVLPHRELLVRNGEILVRGRTRFAGYVNGDVLDEPFDEDGWYATGDLGFLDEDGRLHVTGRKDNRFISGGENIQPEEIEAALLALPGVTEAVVVPVDDEEFGQRPVAFVRVEGETEQLISSLETVLPRFMLPTAILPLQTEASIKPDRTVLRLDAERVMARRK